MNLWVFLAYGLICLAAGYLVRNRDFYELARSRDYWKGEATDFQNRWLKSNNDLSAAEKQLIALRNQSPGRDKSGRFVKKPKVSEVNGSE